MSPPLPLAHSKTLDALSWLLLLALTAARATVAWLDGVSASEAYFILLGEHWEWAHLEGPGGLPALAAVAHALPMPGPRALLLISPLALLLSSWLLWRIIKLRAGSAPAAFFVAVWNALPGVQDASRNFTPEAPLWFFTLLFAAACLNGLVPSEPPQHLAANTPSPESPSAAHSLHSRVIFASLAALAGAAAILISYQFALVLAGFWLWLLSGSPFFHKFLNFCVALIRHLRLPTTKSQRPNSPVHKTPFPKAPPSHHTNQTNHPPVCTSCPRLLSLLPAILPLVALTGPLLWNASNDWIGFAGFTWRGLLDWTNATTARQALLSLLQTGGWFLALLVSWGFVLLAFKLSRSLLRNLRAQSTSCSDSSGVCASSPGTLLFMLALPAALAAVLQIARGHCPQNPFLLAAPLALASWASWPRSSQNRRHPRLQSVLASLALLGTVCFSWLQTLSAKGPSAREPDWAALARRTSQIAHIYQSSQPLFIIAGTPQSAAALNFWWPHDRASTEKTFPRVFLVESQDARSQFALWPRYDEFLPLPPSQSLPQNQIPADVSAPSPFPTGQTDPGEIPEDIFTEQQGWNPYLGRDALYITTEPPDELPQTINRGFSSLRLVEKITDLKTNTTYYIYLCSDYRTAPL